MAIEPVILEKGALFTLTNDDHIGNLRHVAVNFSRLPEVVKLSDGLFLNDGNIQLEDAIGQSFVETAYLLLFMNNIPPPTTIAPIPAHIGMVTVSFSLMANSIDPISARCV
jgi:hypothetical protein